MSRYPSLPTLETRNGSFIPMELVDVEPARVKKITDEQRALLCRYSTIAPPMYCKSITQIRDNPKQQCFEQDPFIKAWNLNVDIEMLVVPARVLPMPEIVYTNQYRVTLAGIRDVGKWELKQTRFYKPADFPTVWAMINLSSIDQEACKEFYYEISNVAQQRGIDCHPPDIYEERNADDYSTDQIVSILKEMMNKNEDCRFFLVILPSNIRTRTQAYKTVKKLVK
jgi:eukaryotic translation initiation factor 2C